MNFRTPLNITRSTAVDISPTTPLVTLGSCFADEIGSRLARDGFDVVANPAGPLFNPLSIATYLTWAMADQPLPHQWLAHNGTQWHSWLHHTKIGADSADRLEERVVADARRLRQQLLKPGAVLAITLGSTHIYSLATNGLAVANCHKYPASTFVESELTLKQVRQALQDILAAVPAGVKVIATVSPIRHNYGQGMHHNTLAKAKLHLAIDDCDVTYFPAFEALVDDLRDYRFYGPDMLHPSDVAADYVYDLFQQAFMDSHARAFAADYRKYSQLRAHIPADPAKHQQQLARALDALTQKYPHLSTPTD